MPGGRWTQATCGAASLTPALDGELPPYLVERLLDDRNCSTSKAAPLTSAEVRADELRNAPALSRGHHAADVAREVLSGAGGRPPPTLQYAAAQLSEPTARLLGNPWSTPSASTIWTRRPLRADRSTSSRRSSSRWRRR
ncbi:MAG: hypothetical protein R2854_30935 [Caldilineaceae bacterium]